MANIAVRDGVYEEALKHGSPERAERAERRVERFERKIERKMESAEKKAERRVERLSMLAKVKIMAAGGEWVRWSTLRPAYRDRDLYEDDMWAAVYHDPEFETHEAEHGSQRRRKVRHVPIL